MEIKNKLTGTQGEGDRDNREKRGNIYKGPMDKDNGEGIVFGSWG